MKRLLKSFGIAAVSLLLLMLTACGTPKWQAQFDLGMKSLTEGNYQEAIAAFTAVIEIDPKNVPAYMGRAQAYTVLNEYEQALADYDAVLTMEEIGKDVLVDAYMGRAAIYEKLERYEEALADYSAVIDLLQQEESLTEESAEKLQQCLMKRAALYVMQEKYQEAIVDYSAVLEQLEPEEVEDTESESAEESESTAEEEAAENETEPDTEQLAQTVKLLEREIKAAMGRANAYSVLEQYEEAEADYTLALDVLNEYPEQTNDDETAEDSFVPAEKQKVAYQGRAEANVMLAKYTEAVQDYDAAIALGAEEEEALDYLLEQVSLWKSQCVDLGATEAWLAEVGHEDAVDSLLTGVELLRTLKAEAAENGTKGYDAVKAAVTDEAAQNEMRTLLAAGYQLRLYDAESGKMTALYAASTAWEDVNEVSPAEPEISALVEKIHAKTLAGKAEVEVDPDMEDAAEYEESEEEVAEENAPQEISLKPLSLYYGGHVERSREGDGLWMIVNGADRDLNAESYVWEKDEPQGGFKKKIVQESYTSYGDGADGVGILWPGSTTYSYAIGGTSVKKSVKSVSYNEKGRTFEFSQPIQAVRIVTAKDESRFADKMICFEVPAGTVVRLTSTGTWSMDHGEMNDWMQSKGYTKWVNDDRSIESRSAWEKFYYWQEGADKWNSATYHSGVSVTVGQGQSIVIDTESIGDIGGYFGDGFIVRGK